MKQITMIFRMIAVCTFLALFAGCSGGVFIDPGHGGSTGGGGGLGGLGGGGGSKPSQLSSSASYNEANAKLDEIIAYCESHPGGNNTASMGIAQSMKSALAIYSSNWSFMSSEIIPSINELIDQLE